MILQILEELYVYIKCLWISIYMHIHLYVHRKSTRGRCKLLTVVVCRWQDLRGLLLFSFHVSVRSEFLQHYGRLSCYSSYPHTTLPHVMGSTSCGISTHIPSS